MFTERKSLSERISFNDFARNWRINEEYCTQQAMSALAAIEESSRLASLVESGKITLPPSNAGHCVKIRMNRGSCSLDVSFGVCPDRCGNRIEYNEIGPGKPPSTMEILMGFVGIFTDNEIEEFGYDGDVKTFYWNSDPDAQEDGFSEVIDELIRLRTILDAQMS